MAAPTGHKLVGAWSPPEFADAVSAVADARGISRSELMREALVREALDARRRPPEVRAKISAGKKGRPHSPEHRAAIAAALRRDGATPITCPRCGKVCRGRNGLGVHRRFCEGTVAYVRCGGCGREMPPGGQLAQHQTATGHTGREPVP